MKLRFAEGTIVRNVLYSIALGGCFPVKAAEILGYKVTIQRIIRRMRDEKYVLYYDVPCRCVTLSSYGVKKLKEISPERYEHYNQSNQSGNSYVFSGLKNDNIDEIRKARRMIYQSEILCMFDSLGVSCWLFDKPELTVQNKNQVITKNDSIYYTSIELKGVDQRKQESKYQHTRCYGLLFCPGGIYMVYNVGAGKIDWNKYGENKMLLHAEDIVTHNYVTTGKYEIKDAILYIKNYSLLAEILSASENKNAKRKYEFLSFDNNFENMYCIPVDIFGKMVTQLLLLPEHHKLILDYVFEDDDYNRNVNEYIDCDAKKNEEYYFSFLECNISRLKNIKLAMSFDPNLSSKYHIFCYQWQVAMLKEYMPQVVNLHIINAQDLLEYAITQ